MPTKAEIESRVEDLENEVRRLHRALGQTAIDLKEVPKRLIHNARPHRSPRSVEAIKRAEAEWEMIVKEPDARIDDYIRSRDGIGWTWEKPYTANRQFAWCGAFAAWCWSSVRFSIRQKIFPSCYRLYSKWGNSARHIEIDQMQPGDIVVVYTSKRSAQGDHITLCVEAPCDGSFKTIEGNAFGTSGDGTRAEGVVKNTRSLDQVAHVYRLLADDFDE
jgi:hypothetical protein